MRECRCDDGQLRRYRMKLSGPLLDRIDLHVSVPPVRWRDLSGAAATAMESSVTVRARVLRARERQRLRYRGCGYLTNAELPVGALRSHCPTAPKADQLLERAVRGLGLSMRAYVRMLRVARTIADLEGVDRLSATHVAEAVGKLYIPPPRMPASFPLIVQLVKVSEELALPMPPPKGELFPLIVQLVRVGQEYAFLMPPPR